jgi:hypothetical protein
MHIEKVNYQKTYNLGNYTSEKIGVELVLHQGESADKALDIAKELVEEYHKRHLLTISPDYEHLVEYPVSNVIKTQSPQTLAQKTKQFIDECKTVEDLKAWELMSKSSADLKEYYNSKLLKLKNK